MVLNYRFLLLQVSSWVELFQVQVDKSFCQVSVGFKQAFHVAYNRTRTGLYFRSKTIYLNMTVSEHVYFQRKINIEDMITDCFFIIRLNCGLIFFFRARLDRNILCSDWSVLGQTNVFCWLTLNKICRSRLDYTWSGQDSRWV